jgi:hypothetical protein
MLKQITETISDDSIDIINLANYAGHVLPTDIDSHTIAKDITELVRLRLEADMHAGIHQVLEIEDCINILKVVLGER